MPEWRSGSATPLHGEGRQFNPGLGYHIQGKTTDIMSVVFLFMINT